MMRSIVLLCALVWGVKCMAADKVQAEAIQVALEDETIWDDPARWPKLVKYLNAVRDLRSESFIPVLSKHLAFSPYNVRPEPPSTIPAEQRFPAWAAIVAIGTPTVPAMIGVIRSVDYKDAEHFGGRTHALALLAIEEIYEPGGHGASLTKLQLELSAAKAEGVERERLLHAAQYSVLLDRIKDGQ